MPKNKDLKKLVRARMSKTGESYTAARSQLTGDALKEKWGVLAGKTDETILRATGRGWIEWVAFLDERGAAKMSHTEIARLAVSEPGVTGWWSQSVAVGYERIRGLRDPNQQRSGEYTTSKSKTIGVPVEKLYRAFANKRARDKWLPDVALKIRTSIADKSLRITWPDATHLDVAFIAKSEAKSTVTVTHLRLTSRDAVAASKAYWTERLAILAETLAP